jgi:hypothetical protein
MASGIGDRENSGTRVNDGSGWKIASPVSGRCFSPLMLGPSTQSRQPLIFARALSTLPHKLSVTDPDLVRGSEDLAIDRLRSEARCMTIVDIIAI